MAWSKGKFKCTQAWLLGHSPDDEEARQAADKIVRAAKRGKGKSEPVYRVLDSFEESEDPDAFDEWVLELAADEILCGDIPCGRPVKHGGKKCGPGFMKPRTRQAGTKPRYYRKYGVFALNRRGQTTRKPMVVCATKAEAEERRPAVQRWANCTMVVKAVKVKASVGARLA